MDSDQSMSDQERPRKLCTLCSHKVVLTLSSCPDQQQKIEYLPVGISRRERVAKHRLRSRVCKTTSSKERENEQNQHMAFTSPEPATFSRFDKTESAVCSASMSDHVMSGHQCIKSLQDRQSMRPLYQHGLSIDSMSRDSNAIPSQHTVPKTELIFHQPSEVPFRVRHIKPEPPSEEVICGPPHQYWTADLDLPPPSFISDIPCVEADHSDGSYGMNVEQVMSQQVKAHSDLSWVLQSGVFQQKHSEGRHLSSHSLENNTGSYNHSKLPDIWMLDVYLTGISGRFPGASNVEELQQLLETGKSQSHVDKRERWPQTLFGNPLSVLRINDESRFDANFWEMTEEEAQHCNPVLRILLEVVYECVLDSGLTLSDLQGSKEKTGIYLAVPSDLDGYITARGYLGCRLPYEATSSEMAVVIGGKLRLKGPAVCFDAGSNSSAVAIHNAIRDLQRGLVHYAIVAGGNLLLNPYTTFAMKQEIEASGLGDFQADAMAAILFVREERLCQRIYSTVKGVGFSCFSDPASFVAEAKSVCERNGIRYVIRDFGKKNGGYPDYLGHCESATALVAIIRTVLEVQKGCQESAFLKTQHLNEHVIVHSEGVRDEQGYIILAPYLREDDEVLSFPNTTLLPLKLRQAAGFEKVCQAICDSSFSPQMMELLSQSLLVMDKEQAVPGYVVVSHKQEILSQGIQSMPVKDDMNCILFFGDFFANNFRLNTDITTIPGFNASRLESLEILIEIQTSNPEFHHVLKDSEYFFVYEGTLIQIALADALKCCISSPMSVAAAGLGTLAAAYYDGCLTRRQCFHIVFCLISALKEWSEHEESDHVVLLVKMPRDQVYTLGPRVTVLAVYTDTLSLISIRISTHTGSPRYGSPAASLQQDTSSFATSDGLSTTNSSLEKTPDSAKYDAQSESSRMDVSRKSSSQECEEDSSSSRDVFQMDSEFLEMEETDLVFSVMDAIEDKGGTCTEVPLTPFYNPLLNPNIRDLLLKKIRNIICKPLMWSANAMHVNHHSQATSVKDLQCDAENIVDNLLYPIDQPTMLRYALLEPSVVMVTNLLCCSEVDVKGVSSEEDAGSSPRLLELKADPVSFFTLLGELHLFGCTLNTKKLSCHSKQRVADCRVPPLSPLVSWNHDRQWPMPSWTEFSCREKDELRNLYMFEVCPDDTGRVCPLGDILYHTWFAVDSKQQGMSRTKASAVRLFNMNLCFDVVDDWMAFPFFVHAHTGRRVFQVYVKDTVIIRGNFEAAAEMDMVEEQSSACPQSQEEALNQMMDDIEGSKWLPFFRWMMSQLQFTVKQERGLQDRELFLQELLVLPQCHLPYLESRLPVVLSVEQYTGVYKVGGITLRIASSNNMVCMNPTARPITVPTEEGVTTSRLYNVGDKEETKSEQGQTVDKFCSEIQKRDLRFREEFKMSEETYPEGIVYDKQNLPRLTHQGQPPLEERQRKTTKSSMGDNLVQAFVDSIQSFSQKASQFENVFREGLVLCNQHIPSVSFSSGWHDCAYFDAEQAQALLQLLAEGRCMYVRVMHGLKTDLSAFEFSKQPQEDSELQNEQERSQSQQSLFSICYHMWRFSTELCKATSIFLHLIHNMLQGYLNADLIFQNITSSLRNPRAQGLDKDLPADETSEQNIYSTAQGSKAFQSVDTIPDTTADLTGKADSETLAQEQMMELKENLLSLYVEVCVECIVTRDTYEDLADLTCEELLVGTKQGQDQHLILLSVMMMQTLACHLEWDGCGVQLDSSDYHWLFADEMVSHDRMAKCSALIAKFCEHTGNYTALGVYADLFKYSDCAHSLKNNFFRNLFLRKLVQVIQQVQDSPSWIFRERKFRIVKRIQLLKKVEEKLLGEQDINSPVLVSDTGSEINMSEWERLSDYRTPSEPRSYEDQFCITSSMRTSSPQSEDLHADSPESYHSVFEGEAVLGVSSQQGEKRGETKEEDSCSEDYYMCDDSVAVDFSHKISKSGQATAISQSPEESIHLKQPYELRMLDHVEDFDQIKMLTVDVIDVCKDINVLLFTGFHRTKTFKVAGVLCPRYKDATLCVPVIDSWNQFHTIYLLYNLISAHIMWRAELGNVDTVVVEAPADPLPLSFLVALKSLSSKQHVVALTDAQSHELVEYLCPGIFCSLGSEEPFSVLPDDLQEKGYLAAHVKWMQEGVHIEYEQRQPTDKSDASITQMTEMSPAPSPSKGTDVKLDLRKAVQETLVGLGCGDHEETLKDLIQQLLLQLPDIDTVQRIIQIGTSAYLGSGLKRLQTYELGRQMTLTSLLEAIEPQLFEVQIVPYGASKSDLGFLSVIRHLFRQNDASVTPSDTDIAQTQMHCDSSTELGIPSTNVTQTWGTGLVAMEKKQMSSPLETGQQSVQGIASVKQCENWNSLHRNQQSEWRQGPITEASASSGPDLMIKKMDRTGKPQTEFKPSDSVFSDTMDDRGSSVHEAAFSLNNTPGASFYPGVDAAQNMQTGISDLTSPSLPGFHTSSLPGTHSAPDQNVFYLSDSAAQSSPWQVDRTHSHSETSPSFGLWRETNHGSLEMRNQHAVSDSAGNLQRSVLGERYPSDSEMQDTRYFDLIYHDDDDIQMKDERRSSCDKMQVQTRVCEASENLTVSSRLLEGHGQESQELNLHSENQNVSFLNLDVAGSSEPAFQEITTRNEKPIFEGISDTTEVLGSGEQESGIPLRNNSEYNMTMDPTLIEGIQQLQDGSDEISHKAYSSIGESIHHMLLEQGSSIPYPSAKEPTQITLEFESSSSEPPEGELNPVHGVSKLQEPDKPVDYSSWYEAEFPTLDRLADMTSSLRIHSRPQSLSSSSAWHTRFPAEPASSPSLNTRTTQAVKADDPSLMTVLQNQMSQGKDPEEEGVHHFKVSSSDTSSMSGLSSPDSFGVKIIFGKEQSSCARKKSNHILCKEADKSIWGLYEHKAVLAENKFRRASYRSKGSSKSPHRAKRCIVDAEVPKAVPETVPNYPMKSLAPRATIKCCSTVKTFQRTTKTDSVTSTVKKKREVIKVAKWKSGLPIWRCWMSSNQEIEQCNVLQNTSEGKQMEAWRTESLTLECPTIALQKPVRISKARKHFPKTARGAIDQNRDRTKGGEKHYHYLGPKETVRADSSSGEDLISDLSLASHSQLSLHSGVDTTQAELKSDSSKPGETEMTSVCSQGSMASVSSLSLDKDSKEDGKNPMLNSEHGAIVQEKKVEPGNGEHSKESSAVNQSLVRDYVACIIQMAQLQYETEKRERGAPAPGILQEEIEMFRPSPRKAEDLDKLMRTEDSSFSSCSLSSTPPAFDATTDLRNFAPDSEVQVGFPPKTKGLPPFADTKIEGLSKAPTAEIYKAAGHEHGERQNLFPGDELSVDCVNLVAEDSSSTKGTITELTEEDMKSYDMLSEEEIKAAVAKTEEDKTNDYDFVESAEEIYQSDEDFEFVEKEMFRTDREPVAVKLQPCSLSESLLTSDCEDFLTTKTEDMESPQKRLDRAELPVVFAELEDCAASHTTTSTTFEGLDLVQAQNTTEERRGEGKKEIISENRQTANGEISLDMTRVQNYVMDIIKMAHAKYISIMTSSSPSCQESGRKDEDSVRCSGARSSPDSDRHKQGYKSAEVVDVTDSQLGPLATVSCCQSDVATDQIGTPTIDTYSVEVTSTPISDCCNEPVETMRHGQNLDLSFCSISVSSLDSSILNRTMLVDDDLSGNHRTAIELVFHEQDSLPREPESSKTNASQVNAEYAAIMQSSVNSSMTINNTPSPNSMTKEKFTVPGAPIPRTMQSKSQPKGQDTASYSRPWKYMSLKSSTAHSKVPVSGKPYARSGNLMQTPCAALTSLNTGFVESPLFETTVPSPFSLGKIPAWPLTASAAVQSSSLQESGRVIIGTHQKPCKMEEVTCSDLHYTDMQHADSQPKGSQRDEGNKQSGTRRQMAGLQETVVPPCEVFIRGKSMPSTTQCVDLSGTVNTDTSRSQNDIFEELEKGRDGSEFSEPLSPENGKTSQETEADVENSHQKQSSDNFSQHPFEDISLDDAEPVDSGTIQSSNQGPSAKPDETDQGMKTSSFTVSEELKKRRRGFFRNLSTPLIFDAEEHLNKMLRSKLNFSTEKTKLTNETCNHLQGKPRDDVDVFCRLQKLTVPQADKECKSMNEADSQSASCLNEGIQVSSQGLEEMNTNPKTAVSSKRQRKVGMLVAKFEQGKAETSPLKGPAGCTPASALSKPEPTIDYSKATCPISSQNSMTEISTSDLQRVAPWKRSQTFDSNSTKDMPLKQNSVQTDCNISISQRIDLDSSQPPAQETFTPRRSSLQTSDMKFMATSTPWIQTAEPRHKHNEFTELNLSAIPPLAPWQKSQQNVSAKPLTPGTVQTVIAPWKRSSTDVRNKTSTITTNTLHVPKRSKQSCTLCPDWPSHQIVSTERNQNDFPPRKTSVVNKTGRKLTPYSPGVQGLLTPAVVQSSLQLLAPMKGKSATIRPLYIVHPITGSVEILKELAEGLEVVCYGIKRTHHTPDFSVEALARFYCQAISQQDDTGPYNLAGYSYGGLVVFEMARQFQREGKNVGHLLMLDGSPDYVKAQTSFPQRSLPPNTSPQRTTAVVETQFLLYFMAMYGPVQQRTLVQAMLEEQETQEERVAAAIGITMGTVQVSSSVARGHWLGLKSKMQMARQGHKAKVSIGHVADDIIGLKRQQKAIQFVQAANIANKYDATEEEQFQGDIHLIRIKKTPAYSYLLPADYGLGRLCAGSVWTHYVDGEHESMMEDPYVQPVVSIMNNVLRTGNK